MSLTNEKACLFAGTLSTQTLRQPKTHAQNAPAPTASGATNKKPLLLLIVTQTANPSMQHTNTQQSLRWLLPRSSQSGRTRSQLLDHRGWCCARAARVHESQAQKQQHGQERSSHTMSLCC